MMGNKAIGGYFELEVNQGQEYHNEALSLNTGRHSLEYILITKKYKKIYLPYFTCEVILEPIKRQQVEYSFYSIDEEFKPIFDFQSVKENEVFLYTNYFGICNRQVEEISSKGINLIIDNAQAFFSKPFNKVDTFYSARKFFGVPDGAYLYTDKLIDKELEKESALSRINHLVKRIELGPEAGYSDFKENDQSFKHSPIKWMSNFSQRILKGINYEQVLKARNDNFQYLHDHLGSMNQLTFDLSILNGPMAYPFLFNKKGIREKLISNNIFVPTYWPNVLKEAEKNSWEYTLASKVLPLPIDQRYSIEDMKIITNLLKHEN